jgi:virginiamycin B lyase
MQRRTLLAALLLPLVPTAATPPSGEVDRLLNLEFEAREPTLIADSVAITEWTVPWARSRPRDPFADARSRVWFVGQTGNYVAYLEPSSGEFRRYELEQGTLPHNLIVDAKGQVWFAGNAAGYIGRLDPTSGKITKYPMPDPGARDPHTLIEDGAGNIWFTVQGGNFAGKLDMQTGKVQLMKVPTPNARPYGIAIDSKGHPWICEFGTNKLATIDPATMRLREYDLPNKGAHPRRIEITSDDRVWYVDYTLGTLGRLDPATGAVKEWPTPGGASSRPYAMEVDDRNRLWFIETGLQPNRLVGFDPASEKFFSTTPIAESGAGTVRHMTFDRATGSLWFGTDANTIGRAKVE